MSVRRVQIASRTKLRRQGRGRTHPEAFPDEVDESDTDSTKVGKSPQKRALPFGPRDSVQGRNRIGSGTDDAADSLDDPQTTPRTEV